MVFGSDRSANREVVVILSLQWLKVVGDKAVCDVRVEGFSDNANKFHQPLAINDRAALRRTLNLKEADLQTFTRPLHFL